MGILIITSFVLRSLNPGAENTYIVPSNETIKKATLERSAEAAAKVTETKLAQAAKESEVRIQRILAIIALRGLVARPENTSEVSGIVLQGSCSSSLFQSVPAQAEVTLIPSPVCMKTISLT